jgi:hypothetical protein
MIQFWVWPRNPGRFMSDLRPWNRRWLIATSCRIKQHTGGGVKKVRGRSQVMFKGRRVLCAAQLESVGVPDELFGSVLDPAQRGCIAIDSGNGTGSWPFYPAL